MASISSDETPNQHGGNNQLEMRGFNRIPPEIQSKIVLDSWRRPGFHQLQIGFENRDWATDLELIDETTCSAPVFYGNPVSSGDYTRQLLLGPPRRLVTGSLEDRTKITNVGWFTDSNDSAYARWGQHREINILAREEIERVCRKEPGWVGIPLYGIENKFIVNPLNDVIAIQGLEITQLTYKLEKCKILMHGFPNIFFNLRRVCFEMLPPTGTPDETLRPSDMSLYFVDPDRHASDIFWLSINLPRVEVVYLLDRSVTLKEGQKVPKDAVRFFGNHCTFIELKNDFETDENSPWTCGGSRSWELAAAVQAAHDNLHAKLQNLIQYPFQTLGVDFRFGPEWVREIWLARRARFVVKVLARLDDIVE